jgi:hypothetical protein
MYLIHFYSLMEVVFVSKSEVVFQSLIDAYFVDDLVSNFHSRFGMIGSP